MKSNDNFPAHYQIQKLIVTHGAELADNHSWIWEHDRWKELVFCLLTRISNKDHDELHLVCDKLFALGLLDIPMLAEIEDSKNDHYHVLMTDFFLENGFTKKEAAKAIVTVSEVAKGLKKNFKGRIQEYLRSYGILLLKEVSKKFRITKLNEKEVKFAFTYWLQNVMNLPLSLKDESLTAFSKSVGIELDELIESADDIGINIALLDDLVQMESLKHSQH